MPGKNKRKLSGGLTQKGRTKISRSSSANGIGVHQCSLNQSDTTVVNPASQASVVCDIQSDLDNVGSCSVSQKASQMIQNTNTGNTGYVIKCKHCAEEINMAENSEISHLQCCICDNFYHGECLTISETLLPQLYIVVEVGGWSCTACRKVMRCNKGNGAKVPNAKQVTSMDSSLRSEINDIKTQLQSITQFLSSNFAVTSTAWNTAVPVPMVGKAPMNDMVTTAGITVGASTRYADAVIAGRTKSSQNTPSTIDTVLKAVHTDFMDKQHRMKNLVVRGLKPSTDSSVTDADLFQQFCFDHLNITLDVTHCRRLGQRMNGKVQPLLIILPSVDAAQSVLSIAKRLRDSSDGYIKSSVYISPDLTKAEAAAEFERRDSLRRRRLDKQNSVQPVNDLPANPNNVKPVHGDRPDKNISAASGKSPASTSSNTDIQSDGMMDTNLNG